MNAPQSQFLWDKNKLLTNRMSLDKITGLFRSEDVTIPQAQAKLEADTKAKYDHEEIFGPYCNVNEYINCPMDIAYEYAANVYSLEEWTYSVRELKHVKDGLYVAREALAPNTKIYVRSEAYPDSKVIDYLCAWDQGDELWMRYYCRFIDAMETIGKPGTIVMWLNCRHPYYMRDTKNMPKHIMDSQARQDRPWVGDFWKFFGAGHRVEALNLKRILEQRFSK